MALFSSCAASRSVARFALAGLVLTGLSGFRSFEANFAPDADLWARWEAHDPQNVSTIDASDWTALLRQYVSDDGSGLNRFAYGAVSDADQRKLKAFIVDQAALPISTYARPAQKAYWINLYNALTVDVVLDAYPVESIRDIDISPGFFADGPWDKELVSVEGEELTLNVIEHRILRPIWKDARLHYAVNCASVGCPNLQREAFTAENVETLLNVAARSYVNNARGVSISDGEVRISSIYDWFFEDFGKTEEDVLEHLIAHSEDDQAKSLRAIGKLHDTGYDWTLNDAK